ncbi:MAG: hypothetical protein JXA25_10995 [Anaerolineales bacterium]|nr:hypothetical protein [Anaerolineales bacterium]
MKFLHNRPVIWIMAAAVCTLLVGLIVLLLVFPGQAGEYRTSFLTLKKPAVTIIQPADQEVIQSGQCLILAAYAVSTSSLGRVEFLVDGILNQTYQPAGGSVEELVTFTWFSSSVGIHRLSVIAYDIRGATGNEASVVIGVQAAEKWGESVEVVDDTGISAHQSETDAASNAGSGNSGENVGTAEGASEDSQGAAGVEGGLPDENGANGPDMPPEPVDEGPEITFFESSIEIVDGGPQDGQLQVTVITVARDDVGLDRLDLFWVAPDGHDNGQLEPISGETTRLCAGQQQCILEVTNVDPAEGLWVYSVQAWDTSGQSDTAFERFEVLAGDADPPAAAEHDDQDAWLSDWLREHLFVEMETLNTGGAGHWGEVLEVEDILDLLGRGRNAPENEGDMEGDDSRCLNLSVFPTAQGNQLTVEVTCDLELEDDEILFLYIEKYLDHSGARGISLFIEDWYDSGRHSLHVGDTFSWLDQDITCGTYYLYKGLINTAEVVDPELRSFDAVSSTMNVGWATVHTMSAGCSAGSIADINLRAQLIPEGVQIRWDVAPGNPWPEDLPEEGVEFTLEHYDVLTGNSWIMFREVVPRERLLAGHPFQVTHPARCGDESWYTVAAVPANADMSSGSPGWLLRQQIRGLEIPCPEQGIGGIPLEAVSYWSQPNRYGVLLSATIPANFPWPRSEDVTLYLARQRRAVDGCESPPCLGDGWQVIESLGITDHLRGREFTLSIHDQNVNFNEHYVYTLAVRAGDEITYGPSVLYTTVQSPPRPPQILRLIVSSENCESGGNRCVEVEWEQYEQPVQIGYYEQAASIVVERITGGLDGQIFPVALEEARFVDNDLFEMNVELVSGEVRRICNYSTTYRMIAYDAEGHWYGASPLTVDMLACDVAMEQEVERSR